MSPCILESFLRLHETPVPVNHYIRWMTLRSMIDSSPHPKGIPLVSRARMGLVFFIAIGIPLLNAGGGNDSKYAMEYYRAGAGARAEGLGNANAAAALDVTAVYWNPAALAWMSGPQLHGMHSERFAGAVNVDFLAAGIPFGGKAALGVGLYRMGIDGIPVTRLTDPTRPLGAWITDGNGNPGLNVPYAERSVDDQELTLAFTVSVRRSERMSLGVTLKTVHKSVDRYSAWGMGFDVGMWIRSIRGLQLGAVLKDATTTPIAWREGRTEWVHPRLRLGAGLPMAFGGIRITPVTDFEFGADRIGGAASFASGALDGEWHGGLEVGYGDRVAVRIGDNIDRITLGAGFRFSVFHVDYSFSKQSDLGNCHRLSTTMTWDRNNLLRF
jgi:hypothetical protein